MGVQEGCQDIGRQEAGAQVYPGVFIHLPAEELPAVVLIDLNLPKVDGLEVLRRMRADYRTKLIPVAIFTSSVEEQDLINGYSLGANSYVRKPADFQQFSRVVQQLVTYWVALNEPPPPSERIWAHHFDSYRRPV